MFENEPYRCHTFAGDAGSRADILAARSCSRLGSSRNASVPTTIGLASPRRLGAAALFLVSHESSYLSGANLVVQGGTTVLI